MRQMQQNAQQTQWSKRNKIIYSLKYNVTENNILTRNIRRLGTKFLKQFDRFCCHSFSIVAVDRHQHVFWFQICVNNLALGVKVIQTFQYLLQANIINSVNDIDYANRLTNTGNSCASQERIEYKLLSLTYKVLTTSQPTYLSKLVTVQSLRSTRSSSVVTISRPPTSSSLKITNRSFQPRLWNKLLHSFRQPHPHPDLSLSHYPTQVGTTSVTINHSFSFSL